ncbi:efflux RND transporter periplasmic adaptor subunit [Clostridium estertheticum]|uniref:efflux RND transporter periplasmic adaptor subunit n=1 Tax=Clostridium estertheticum TaxID=238834 RepID=UPI001CF25DE5|nr:efflux RND transporter periplasmic adaptor subunit [Clostridium estertheticum]MCB2305993.1 efflux RND transporter periplasmic adaptor subunit [Clostridium estertheticum]MCB2346516.1 efflux RND transporter periplasmic adaptor subunit [Clostridium estertheticum]MCB2349035.1 efflux RND transporter periplasmic adaptor subunit [Clostridium estertheticum]WAG47675.1 efflux RND transporter periplasmic adaptor subunit [Clostridium estertheticum]
MMKLKGIKGFLLISLTLSITLIGVGCGNKEVSVTSNDISKNVKASPVSISSITTTTKYGSKLATSSQTVVTSKIAGKVDGVNVDVGQSVNKGDILFTLDKLELTAQYNVAKAALDTANANLDKTSGSGYEQQLIPANSTLDIAKTTYNDAKNNYNTIHQQYNIGDSAKSELDAAKSKMDSASLQVRAASDSLALLKSKTGPQTDAAAAGQVQQAKASLDLAQIQIDNASIISPINGVISERNVEVGEVVSSAVSAFTIIDASSLRSEVSMTDKDVIKVKVNQKIPVQISSMNNKIVQGIVDTISPSADAKTQLYTVKVKIDNPSNLLKPGMIVRVEFPDVVKTDILVVPNGAIFTENSVQYVYIVDATRLKKKQVVVGISNTLQTEIVSGIKLGDQVVTEGQSFLNEGQKVSIVK